MSDPRATQVYNNSNDEEEITQVLTQLQASQNVNAFFVLSKFIDCPEIKEEPQFCEILFNEHLEVVLQLIEWMLLPKQVVKRKKIKTNVDSYPYQCREFMKDNWCFYEQMYLAARSKKLEFGIWFNFLRKEHFDKQTVYTALGYFADVMIPFAKYQFSGSFNLSQSVEVSQINRQVETLSIMKILPQVLIEELIKYCYYDPIYQFLKTSILVCIEDPRDYDISKSALLKLIKATPIPGIFAKFLLLTPENNDQLAKNIDFIENIAISFKEITQNLQTTNEPFTFRSMALISAIVESNVIKYVVDELMKSRLCGMLGREKQKQRERLHSSVSVTTEGALQNTGHLSLSSSMNTLNFNANSPLLLPLQGCFATITDSDEEDVAETLFRIITALVEVFVRMPRNLNSYEDDIVYEEKCERKGEISMADIVSEAEHHFVGKSQAKRQSKQAKPEQKTSENTLAVPGSPGTLAYMRSKQKIKQFTHEQYTTMTIQFRKSMQYILDNLETLNKFVYNEVEGGVGSSYARIIPFPNGENIKATSMMKVEYFRLVHNCLIMIQIKESDLHSEGQESQSPKQNPRRTSIKRLKSLTNLPFDFRFEKLHLIEIIKKYLVDNCWNNIAHHILQKICHLLIICSYDYVKKNLEKDKYKRFSDNFLSFLIQNFTRKNFIYLNSVRFTHFGNLHSLYNIAKDLAYTLNNTNQLVIFLNEFEPWNNFIMTQLKEYEEKTFPKAIKPEDYEENDHQHEGVNNLKVDEADSIKKLIQNISTTKLWPNKLRNKNLSKSQVFPFRNSGDTYKKDQPKDHMLKTNEVSSHSKPRRQPVHELALEQILKRKMQYSKKGSQIRQFDLGQISVQKQQEKKKGTSKSQIFLSKQSHDSVLSEPAQFLRNNSDPSIKEDKNVQEIKEGKEIKEVKDDTSMIKPEQ